jgi:histidinol-phosphate aminotransferase
MERAAMIPKPAILDIAAYVGGETAVDHPHPARLMSNEGALGPSPMALAAYQDEAARLSFYPQGDSRALRAALGAAHSVEPSRIVCGNGSDDLISLLCYAYAGAGDEVLYSRHGFLLYAIAARAAGATPVAAPEQEYKADVEALLAAVTPRTRLLFLANPNNPTATYLSRTELARLREGLPDTVLLVLDAAYGEFADAPGYTIGHDLVEQYGNVAVLRTFSKAYAMAGLRLGWGHLPESVAGVLNRIRGPFNVNRAAQAAGIAALEDTGHARATIAHNLYWRETVVRGLAVKGYGVLPSQANFVLMDCGQEETAGAVYAHLCGQGVYVRKVKAYGLPAHLRVTIGDPWALKRLLAALPPLPG